MKKLSPSTLRSLAVLAGLTLAIHFAAVFAFPYAMTGFLAARFESKTGKNRFLHARRPGADERVVAMPSPDLVYSAGTFDVSEHPLHICARQPQEYASLSLYAENMDNFFVRNDQQTGNRGFDIVLTGPEGRDPAIPGATLVHSPSATGIMLFRYFAPDDAALSRIEAERRAIRCDPVP